jgi:hypothetical protein
MLVQREARQLLHDPLCAGKVEHVRVAKGMARALTPALGRAAGRDGQARGSGELSVKWRSAGITKLAITKLIATQLR